MSLLNFIDRNRRDSVNRVLTEERGRLAVTNKTLLPILLRRTLLFFPYLLLIRM